MFFHSDLNKDSENLLCTANTLSAVDTNSFILAEQLHDLPLSVNDALYSSFETYVLQLRTVVGEGFKSRQSQVSSV